MSANPEREAARLKPCPFCGGAAEFEQVHDNLWTVGCSDEDGACMGYQSLTVYDRKTEAAAAWNTRALASPDAGATARAAALREAAENAALWHDGQDKALSKQPPSGDRGWRRSEHQEQAYLLRAALASTEEGQRHG